MPLPFSQIAEPTAASLGRFGADARLLASPCGPTGRASETYDQADEWSEDVLRREFGDPSGLGVAFAEPGEMERRERDERWSNGGTRALGLAMSSLLVACLGCAMIAAVVAYPLVLDWLR